MLIQEQFNKLFLLEKKNQPQEFFAFSKSQKKPFYSFQKEQQKFCN